MNDKQRKAMWAGKNKHLLKPEHLEKLLDTENRIGSKSFFSEATPKQYDVNGKPLPTFYSQDYHTNMRSDDGSSGASQGFISKVQEGVPKLNKKHWYKIQYNDQLAGVATKKSLSGFAGEDGRWERAKDGVYWSGDSDDAIMLIRGDLLTQKELSQYYINRIKSIRQDDPFNEYGNAQSNHPFRDTNHICKICGSAKGMTSSCKMCGSGIHVGSGISNDYLFSKGYWAKKNE